MAIKKELIKITVTVLLLFIIGMIFYIIWFSRHYKEIVKEKLSQWVATASNGAYRLSVQDVDISLFQHRINATGIKLWPDSTRMLQLSRAGHKRAYIYTFFFPSVQVVGVNWSTLYHSKELNCTTLTITKPQLMVVAQHIDTSKTIQDSSKTKRSVIERLHADHIYIDEPEIAFTASAKENSFACDLKGGKIHLNDWSFDRNTHHDTTSFFYAKSGTVSLGTFTYVEPGNLYKIYSSGLEFTSGKNYLILKQLRIAPILDKEAYYERIGVQKEIYNFSFPLVEFKNLNWKKIIEDKMLYASDMYLHDPVFDVYLSRYPPPNTQSKVGKFPVQLLQKAGLSIYIPHAYITGGIAKYTELNRQTGKAGVVLFNNIHGTCTNITNIDSLIRINNHCILQLNGTYGHLSPAYARFNFTLSDKKGLFIVDGVMSNINEPQISPTAEALALAKIKSVHVSKYTMHIQGNEDHASGTFTLLYNNLKLDIEEMHKGNSNEKHFTTFMTNHVYTFSDNPMPNDKVRTVTTSLTRDRVRSFFNLIWANMYRGALQTAVKDQPLAKNIADNPGAKKSKTRLFKSFFKSIFHKKSK